jgi:hypothetical protein
MDLQLNKDSGSGTFGGDGLTVPVIWANGVYYIQFTDLFITKMGGSLTSGQGAALRNKWVSSDSPLAAKMINSVKDALSYNGILQKVVDEIRGKTFTAAGSDTVNGVAVFAFKSADGTIVAVAATTPHYLIRSVKGSGTVDLTGWNKRVAVTPPPASETFLGPSA